MSTVCASPLLGRLVDLNVLDDQVLRVQALGIRVRLGVLEQAEQELGRLDGPASLADTELLAYSPPNQYWCPFIITASSNASSHMTASSLAMGIRTLGSTASAPSIAPHGHGFDVVRDVLEVGEGAAQLPAVDGLGCLAGVLEGDAQVGAASARALGRFDVGGCVADLYRRDLRLVGVALGVVWTALVS